jgi:hypothetical protein
MQDRAARGQDLHLWRGAGQSRDLRRGGRDVLEVVENQERGLTKLPQPQSQGIGR